MATKYYDNRMITMRIFLCILIILASMSNITIAKDVKASPVHAVAPETTDEPVVSPLIADAEAETNPAIRILPVPPKEAGFVSAFIASASLIIVSEIGDKTFFIAAILAMKQNRTKVFFSAISALALMTILSAAMGFTLPNILPPRLTHWLAIVLFVFFGLKLLKDAYGMDPNADIKEEFDEVEEELERKELNEQTTSLNQLESGNNTTTSANTQQRNLSKRAWFFMRRFFSPITIQCFTMTFLAEWGDRSQIATIALAAAKDPYGVTIGGILGHSLCTGVAVIGGKFLSTRISERSVSIVGGILFLIFAYHAAFMEEW